MWFNILKLDFKNLENTIQSDKEADSINIQENKKCRDKIKRFERNLYEEFGQDPWANTTFDNDKIPDELKALIPLAKKYGVGDDIIRSEIIRRSSDEEIKELISGIGMIKEKIYNLLDSFAESTVMPEEVVRFMYLLEAFIQFDENKGDKNNKTNFGTRS